MIAEWILRTLDFYSLGKVEGSALSLLVCWPRAQGVGPCCTDWMEQVLEYLAQEEHPCLAWSQRQVLREAFDFSVALKLELSVQKGPEICLLHLEAKKALQMLLALLVETLELCFLQSLKIESS